MSETTKVEEADIIWNWFKKNKGTTILLVIVSLIFIILVDKYNYSSEVQAYANIIMVIGLVFAFIQIRQGKKQLEQNKEQLKADHDWNRRQLALTELTGNRKDVTESIRNLNSSINYREQKDSYSLKELHRFLCNDENFEGNNLTLTDDGKEIKHNIFIILNYYEYLAIGIFNEVFDEKIVKDSVKGALIKADKLFGEYIKHLRSEKHTNNPNLFKSLEDLANDWKNEDKGLPSRRDKTA